MVAMREFDIQDPGFVGASVHGIGGGVPTIEVSDQAYRLRLGRDANEIDGAQDFFVAVGTHNISSGDFAE
jgi:hypothetical protein